MTPPKKTNKALVINTKQMEIHELLDKKLKIIVLRSLMNTDGQLHEIRRTIHEQNETFNKEIETINEPIRNPRAEEYSDWTEKIQQRALSADLVMQKKNQ